MPEFKYEMHCHTSEVSMCGRMRAREVVKAYTDAGYDGIVITDHFSPYTFRNQPSLKMSEMADYFLRGYYAAKEAAEGKIDILLGMELTFYENANDYLVYGLTEQFIRKNTNIMDMGIERFSELAHKNDMAVFQAHPFRNHMTVTNPELLDGVEAYNGNMRHDSRNDIALMWAEKFNLKMSSGSDCHQPEDVARGGIITETRLADEKALADVLMSGKVKLIRK